MVHRVVDKKIDRMAMYLSWPGSTLFHKPQHQWQHRCGSPDQPLLCSWHRTNDDWSRRDDNWGS